MIRSTLVTVVLAGASAAASAHIGHDDVSGFASGALHPLSGLDHVVAMVAVGLWAAFLGRKAMRLLPIVFPALMVLGGSLGMAGVALPGVETAIALSAVALGLLIAGQVRPPLAVAAAIVGAFALFHGHAHGAELPQAAGPIAYAAGFVLSTLALHGIGMVAGVAVQRLATPLVARLLGSGIAMVGLAFLAG